MVVTVEQSDAVRTNQRSSVGCTSVQDTLLHLSTLLCLFTEACRDDDEGTRLLVASQQLNGIGTKLGRNHQHGQFGGRQFLGIVENLDALHLVLLGINNTKGALIATL